MHGMLPSMYICYLYYDHHFIKKYQVQCCSRLQQQGLEFIMSEAATFPNNICLVLHNWKVLEASKQNEGGGRVFLEESQVSFHFQLDH